MVLRYRLDERSFQQVLAARGFASIAQFADTFQLNRATIHHYLKGEGPLSEAYYRLCAALEQDPLELLAPVPTATALEYRDEILPLVRELTAMNPQWAIGLLGSRARGAAQRYSDWDLGVTGGAIPVGDEAYLKLKARLDDLAEDLPRFVDLINLDQAPGWFLKEIHYEPIYLGGNPTSWHYFRGVLHGTQKSA